MTQDEAWMTKYNEIVAFLEREHRNPSKHNPEERGRYLNWLKHNRKVFAAGEMKEDRRVKFMALMELSEKYRRKNQYQ